ncbi:MAG: chromate transporter [Clostridia bacterium]|nr:chromate transporter [Clostridia bacterium]
MIFSVFLTLLKIGAFTFGGGYAMVAVLEGELVEKKKWMTHEEFLDMVAIAESTPGPIAINSATYIGYKQAGVLGSIAATLGAVIPSFTVIFIISLFFDKFLGLQVVAWAFRGIRACVVYLIVSAGIKMFKSIEKKPLTIAIFGVTVAALITLTLLSVNFSSVFYILIAAALGLCIYFFGKMRKKKEGDEK